MKLEHSGSCRRLSLRAWLLYNLESCSIPGARWVDRDLLKFRLPWLHGSSRGWTKDANRMYVQWAKYSGNHCMIEKAKPKKWKANFRCAMNSLKDIKECRADTITRGPTACRVYHFSDTKKVRAAYRQLESGPEGIRLPEFAPLTPPSSPATSPAPSPQESSSTTSLAISPDVTPTVSPACLPASPLDSSPASPPASPSAYPTPLLWSRGCGPDSELVYDSDTSTSSDSMEHEELRNTDLVCNYMLPQVAHSQSDAFCDAPVEERPDEMLMSTPLSPVVACRGNSPAVQCEPLPVEATPTSLQQEGDFLVDSWSDLPDMFWTGYSELQNYPEVELGPAFEGL